MNYSLMTKDELEILLIKKKKELNEKDNEYFELESEIEELQSQIDELDDEMNILGKAIEEIEDIVQEKIIESLDSSVDPSNRFILDFIKASKFCDRHEISCRTSCGYVHIEDNVLSAVNGYIACKIKTVEAPVQGFVKWDVRKDFEKEIVKEDWEVIDIDKYFEDAQGKKFVVINKKEFESLVIEKTNEEKTISTTTIKVFDTNLLLRTSFLDTALGLFDENEEFKVYELENEVSNLLLENENKKTLVLPIRPAGYMDKH